MRPPEAGKATLASISLPSSIRVAVAPMCWQITLGVSLLQDELQGRPATAERRPMVFPRSCPGADERMDQLGDYASSVPTHHSSSLASDLCSPTRASPSVSRLLPPSQVPRSTAGRFSRQSSAPQTTLLYWTRPPARMPLSLRSVHLAPGTPQAVRAAVQSVVSPPPQRTARTTTSQADSATAQVIDGQARNIEANESNDDIV